MSYEVELIALAVVLFLYDSTVLLYANEAIFTCTRKQEWNVLTSLPGVLIGGRRVCFLPPFALHSPSARLRWNLYATEQVAGDVAWSQELPKLSSAAPWTINAGIGLFVLLPMGLFTPLGEFAVIPAVCLIYGSIIAALFVIRWNCKLPALSRAKFAGFAFECLACPPFGVNLVRRCSLMSQVDEALPTAAERLLDAAQLKILGTHCQAVIDEELLQIGDDSPHRTALEQQRLQFGTWIKNA